MCRAGTSVLLAPLCGYTPVVREEMLVLSATKTRITSLHMQVWPSTSLLQKSEAFFTINTVRMSPVVVVLS